MTLELPGNADISGFRWLTLRVELHERRRHVACEVGGMTFRVSVLGSLTVALLVGCSAADAGDDAGQDPSLEAASSDAAPDDAAVAPEDSATGSVGSESVGSTTQAVVYPHAVGVIPTSSDSCTFDGWTEEYFYLDMQDVPSGDFTNYGNGFNSSWFTRDHVWSSNDDGTELRGTGIKFRFCRVNGDSLPQMDQRYAVLSLATDCPVNADKVSIKIDTEDDGNSNYWSNGLAPNVVNKYAASLSFCLFKATSSPGTFPDFGMPYAVFHDFDVTQPSWVKSKKYFYFDDENDTPSTSYSPSSGDNYTAFWGIFQRWNVGSNYGLFIEQAKVR